MPHATDTLYATRTQASLLCGAGMLLAYALLGRFAPAAAEWLSVALILCAGFPHGADDMHLLRLLGARSRGRQAVAFVAYVATLGATLLLWAASPALALAAFVVVSVAHFAGDHVAQLRGDRGELRVYGWCWAAFALLAPLSWRPAEGEPVVAAMLGAPPPAGLLAGAGWLAAAAGAAAIAYAGWRWRRGGSTAWLAEIVQVLLLAHCYLVFPSLWGFALFFVGVHANASVLNQAAWTGGTVRAHLRRGLPYALAGIAGVPALLVAGYGAALTPVWLAGLFVLISAFTMPHAVVMHVAAARFLPSRPAPAPGLVGG